MAKIIVLLLLGIVHQGFCQDGVGVGTNTPHTTAILDVVATNKGILIPRLATDSINAITSPAVGLLVYNTDTNAFCFYNGAAWHTLNEMVRQMQSSTVTHSGNVSINGTITATNYAVNAIGNGPIPQGGIIMWSGTLANVPAGWALCNGTNGTPDLRERFIVGAASTDNVSVSGTLYSVSNVGGANTVTLTAPQSGLPAHTHAITDPGHTHGIGGGAGTFAVWISNEANAGSGSSGYEVSSNVHPATTDSSITGITINNNTAAMATQAHENRPPYFALAYIIKL